MKIDLESSAMIKMIICLRRYHLNLLSINKVFAASIKYRCKIIRYFFNFNFYFYYFFYYHDVLTSVVLPEPNGGLKSTIHFLSLQHFGVYSNYEISIQNVELIFWVQRVDWKGKEVNSHKTYQSLAISV